LAEGIRGPERERLGRLRSPLKNTPACKVTLTRPLPDRITPKFFHAQMGE
jgi:hypothetical protein